MPYLDDVGVVHVFQDLNFPLERRQAADLGLADGLNGKELPAATDEHRLHQHKHIYRDIRDILSYSLYLFMEILLGRCLTE